MVKSIIGPLVSLYCFRCRYRHAIKTSSSFSDSASVASDFHHTSQEDCVICAKEASQDDCVMCAKEAASETLHLLLYAKGERLDQTQSRSEVRLEGGRERDEDKDRED